LSFLFDGISVQQLQKLWGVYYHLYLDDSTFGFFHTQVKKLLSLAGDAEQWRASEYGRHLKFCDDATFHDFKRILTRYDSALGTRGSQTYLDAFNSSIKESVKVGNMGTVQNLTGLRSAAPLSFQNGTEEIPKAFRHYWDPGTTDTTKHAKRYPNPMFAASMSRNVFLHYGTDPILGFHIATAYATLTAGSPLRPDGDAGGAFKVVEAARVQFFAWVEAFQSARANFTFYFVTSDALVFAHTLQRRLSSGPTRRTANFYRRQFDMTKLELEPTGYGRKEDESQGLLVPLKFDVINTSNLADHLGTLNLLVAASPLLSNKPFSTLQTELLIKRESSEKETFSKLLYGDTLSVSLLLGLTPVEYYTNATASGTDLFLRLMNATGPSASKTHEQVHSRLSWKLNHQFTGQSRFQERLNVDPSELAATIFAMYREMFSFENPANFLGGSEQLMNLFRRSTYAPSHRGSLAALIRLVEHRVKTDWGRMCKELIQLIFQDRSIMMGTNYAQDLALHLHMWGAHSEPWLKSEIKRNNPAAGGVSTWKHIPELVSVTLVVPRQKFKRLFGPSLPPQASPTLLASLKSGSQGLTGWHNLYADIHLSFGTVTTKGPRDSENMLLKVDADPDGWAGTAPLIVCFYAPTCALQVEPRTASIGLCVQSTAQNVAVYGKTLGMELSIYETKLSDESHVFFTKYLPGQNEHPVVCPNLLHLIQRGPKNKDPDRAVLTANADKSTGKITSVTGHIDIKTEPGTTLLENKTPITLRQPSPFVIEVVFGKDQLVRPIHYSVAVSQDTAKTRIARKSSYIEVVARLASPADAGVMSDFVIPTTLDLFHSPATLSIPHVSLGSLPILDPSSKKAIGWLTTHTSLMFSDREKRIRDQTEGASSSGLSADPRVNLKESLFSIFMVSSGLQGGQTGLFTLSHPSRGGVHMLIFVSALRLDGAAASVVADAAVLPLTLDIMRDPDLQTFLAVVQNFKVCSLTVDDAELALWRRILPALAERCRTWEHQGDCEYKRDGATIPLSLELGQAVLCSCGAGKLPPEFVALPEWEVAERYATRVAICPIYAVPFVEDVLDASMLKQTRAATSEKGKEKEVAGDKKGDEAELSEEGLRAMMRSLQVEACRNCGAKEAKSGGALKKCMRCLEAKYCSAECQKKDWKKHRMECEEAREQT